MLVERYPTLRFQRWLPSVLRSVEKSNGAIFDDRLLRGPKGNPLCLWCAKETKGESMLFCTQVRGRTRPIPRFGEGCEHEHRMRRDSHYVRKQLYARDSGVCAECGIDTHALFKKAGDCKTLEQRVAMFRQLARQTPNWQKKVRWPLKSMDYKFTEGMFWEAAHVIDVKHGGGLCGLDGFHTLCVPCHTEEYMRSYAQDLSNLSLYQSPPAATDSALSPTPSNNRRVGSVLSAKQKNAVLPVQQSTGPSKSCTPLILLDSSSSASSSPSPAGNVFIGSTPSYAHETPTKQGTYRWSPRSPKSLTLPRTPLPHLAAIIDLTSPSRNTLQPYYAESELELLTSRMNTVNISSSEELSADEIEFVAVLSSSSDYMSATDVPRPELTGNNQGLTPEKPTSSNTRLEAQLPSTPIAATATSPT
ncbi:hypothetical protein COEREDRAFT_89082 [Coemansia reversa NRRL 1564]|uniref:HNH domain-containing protein n=1 Tax=Coemansia reversa (strain ATCC 12441 / NRRL 1564) TaxID=763665 RepID=A0A2G5B4Q9_COERN|nr:hypothetical protein COEREDRAFT_89082 [Coemansia reversa NRRL 1564]|eukprot:PIA14008.1 hypothetical protein COEREDRAFT_89082 [Coemansia reversa NRRL 1564]